MLIVKVFNVPSKLPKCKLPKHILKHCNQYKDTYTRQASTYAWQSLSKYIDVNKVKFTKNGKPYLVGNKKYFSLSHSFNKVAIAIYNQPIGIDIERVIPFGIVSPLASRLLKGKELKDYHNAKNQSLWFTKYWTKYEAYNKLLGDRLSFETFKQKIIKNTKTKCLYKNSFVLTYVS